MDIILFGTGCDLCRELASNVENAIALSGKEIHFEKSSDLHRMLSFGIKSTPALVIDSDVIAVGKLLSTNDIVSLLQIPDTTP